MRFTRSRPNLLLITIDTLRADHVSSYGYWRPTTPALDRLAREGARFSNASSSGSWTPPALFSIATGAPPHRHRVIAWGDRMNPELGTVAQALAAAGYRTALFNNHNVFFEAQHEITLGFRDVVSLSDGEFPAAPLVDRAIDWLHRNDSRPFFLWVHLFDPHAPFSAPAPYDRFFRDDGPGAEGRRAEPVEGGFGAGGIPHHIYQAAAGETRIERLIAAYDGEIRYTDAQLQRLLDALDRLGLAAGTVVMVTADHGEILERPDTPYHGTVYFSHGTYLFQELLRVPLIVRYPGRLSEGITLEEPVGGVDLAPTLLELAGLTPPPAMSGRSLLPLLARKSAGAAPAILSEELRNNWRAVRWGSYKLIDYGHDGFALYDLENDPGETRNLAEEQPAVAAALKAQLARLSGGEIQHEGSGGLDAETLEKIRALGYTQ
jgi:arylsulfatase A-like enzyme